MEKDDMGAAVLMIPERGERGRREKISASRVWNARAGGIAYDGAGDVRGSARQRTAESPAASRQLIHFGSSPATFIQLRRRELCNAPRAPFGAEV